ncbi:hypothetical protein FOL47_001377 [Perkinsus chesapeaki]|uniref:Uncharacterized protein n=1 Tax=Perkinsus chesapeaki TaxID=330153 RepID=A0A7J6MKC0_PERCH|nr:hypothetical protein FOL47_001377 [Perkinsus chesapeaki]
MSSSVESAAAILPKREGPDSATTPEDALEWEDWKGDIPFIHHAIAGSCAGIAEHVATFPLDTIKTRMQAYSGANGGTVRLSTVLESVKSEYGLKGFVRGWGAIATGCVPAHIALFSVYEKLKDLAGVQNEHCAYRVPKSLLCGALAQFAHDSILTPMDVVKQRLQLGCYRGTFHCIKSMVRTEGAVSLFRSLPVTALMNAPQGAVTVAVNEAIKRVWGLGEGKGNHLPAYFASAGIAGGIASLTTQPLDVIKTRLQTQDCLCRKDQTKMRPKVCPRKLAALQARGIVSATGELLVNPAEIPEATMVKLRARGIDVANLKSSIRPASQASTAPRYSSVMSAAKLIWMEEGFRGFFRGMVPRFCLSIPATATCWGSYETVKALLARWQDLHH